MQGSAARKSNCCCHLVVVQLEVHAIMHLIVCQRNVVFVDGVPFLNADLLWPRASLCCHQLLQVPDRVVFIALHADLLAQAIVEDYLNHADCLAAAVAVAPAAVVPVLLLWWCW
jgi:hypothetical protein